MTCSPSPPQLDSTDCLLGNLFAGISTERSPATQRTASTANRKLASVALAAILLALCGCAAGVYKVPGTAQKLCQLTGELDAGRSPPVQTVNRTETRAKLRGTDLGISVPGPFGSIFFLFGDSIPTGDIQRPVGADSIAYTTVTDDPNDCLHLTFLLARDGGFRPPVLLNDPAGNPIALGNWDVPTGGFFWNGNAYVTFQVDAKDEGDGYRPHRSVMGRASRLIYDDPTFARLYDFDPERFLNIASVLVGDDWLPSATPTRVLYFGTGRYRKADNVQLAQAELSSLDKGDRSYLTGIDAAGAPVWGGTPDAAVGVFSPANAPCMGELSVTWNPYLRKWLMLYGCDQPRGINFRVADHPWGPWSAPALLFEPRSPTEGGYCSFMHDALPCPAGSPNPQDDLRSGGPGCLRWRVRTLCHRCFHPRRRRPPHRDDLFHDVDVEPVPGRPDEIDAVREIVERALATGGGGRAGNPHEATAQVADTWIQRHARPDALACRQCALY
jgi:hypothetical protein